MAFVGILSQVNLLFWPLVIRLVRYVLKHLSVRESGGYLPPLRWIIANYSELGRARISSPQMFYMYVNNSGALAAQMAAKRSPILI